MSKVLFFGNFNYEKGFASVQRCISIGRLFSLLGFSPVIFLESESILPKNEICFSRINLRSNFKKYFDSKYWINILKRQSDVSIVVLYDFPAFITRPILKYCKSKNIKVLSDITEWFGATSKNILFDFVKRIDTFLRIRVLAKKTDGILTVSTYLFNYYEKIVNKLIIYPIPIEQKTFKRTSGLHDEIRIGYFGNPGRKKDNLYKIVNLLSATKKDIKFIVAGSIPDSIIKRLSKIEFWRNNSVYYGNISSEKVIELLSSCDYQILYRDSCRSNNAGFPSKVSESLVNGINVICSDVSDVSRVIGDKENIILTNDFKKDLSIMIKRLTKNIDKIISLNPNVFSIDYYMKDFRIFLERILEVRL